MKKLTAFVIAAMFLSANLFSQTTNWPTWRGINCDGVALTGTPPTEWSETKNVKWKADIPGLGHSTPVTWGDNIYLTSAIETGKSRDVETANGTEQSTEYDFVLIAYNRHTGKELWKTTLITDAPKEIRTHADDSRASGSPITDGKYIYTFFGSQGLFCVDMQGKTVWNRNFGQMTTKNSFGEGISPTLYKDKLVVLWYHDGASSIYVLDKNTGNDVWTKAVDESTAWATPLVVENNGKPLLISCGINFVKGYDFENGNELWQTSWSNSPNVVSHPIEKDGIVYVARTSYIKAIDLSKAKGNIDNTDALVWVNSKNGPHVASPVLIGDKLYYIWDCKGSLSCVDLKTGSVFYERQELPDMGQVYASPVAANRNLYFVGGSGTGYTVKQGDKFQIIATNKLDDKFHASPIIVDNDLYLRGFNSLYCISND